MSGDYLTGKLANWFCVGTYRPIDIPKNASIGAGFQLEVFCKPRALAFYVETIDLVMTPRLQKSLVSGNGRALFRYVNYVATDGIARGSNNLA